MSLPPALQHVLAAYQELGNHVTRNDKSAWRLQETITRYVHQSLTEQ
jgi:hypothetical protein